MIVPKTPVRLARRPLQRLLSQFNESGNVMAKDHSKKNRPLTVEYVTRSRTRDKPGKPYPEFPLYAHPNGQWAKRTGGKLHYFGLWCVTRTDIQRAKPKN